MEPDEVMWRLNEEDKSIKKYTKEVDAVKDYIRNMKKDMTSKAFDPMNFNYRMFLINQGYTTKGFSEFKGDGLVRNWYQKASLYSAANYAKLSLR